MDDGLLLALVALVSAIVVGAMSVIAARRAERAARRNADELIELTTRSYTAILIARAMQADNPSDSTHSEAETDLIVALSSGLSKSGQEVLKEALEGRLERLPIAPREAAGGRSG